MHANAPLTPTGRRILCERINKGRPIAHVAVEMGVLVRSHRSGGTAIWLKGRPAWLTADRCLALVRIGLHNALNDALSGYG